MQTLQALVALLIGTILLGLSALHVYWAATGRSPRVYSPLCLALGLGSLWLALAGA
jgi:hypothetical protein